MSEMPALNPNKHYGGWEAIEEDNQELAPKGPSEQRKKPQPAEHFVEHHQLDGSDKESSGVKLPQKAVYDVDDDDDDDDMEDEATENYNNEAAPASASG